MFKMLFAFLIVFSSLYLLIPAYRKLQKKDKWSLVKLVAFSAVCALLSLVLLSLIVIIF